jgi:hypothetical protein
MPVSISGTNGVTFPDSSLQTAAASPYVLKNRIINGDFRIDQRNAGASVATTTTGNIIYTVDRWAYVVSQASKFTVQQNAGSVTPPSGFTNYLGMVSTSAYTVTSTDYFQFQQYIEGYNAADLAWGTASAKTITVSFWVYSSLTGNFGMFISNSDASRVYPTNYTINSANTWEQKTITITGDTSGTWLTTNGRGIRLAFLLGYGSSYVGGGNAWNSGTYFQPTGCVNLVANNGATLYITGVQLEQNTSATPFERRLYNQELANCQRYYFKVAPGSGGYLTETAFAISTTGAYGANKFPVTMRTAPTSLEQSGTAGDYRIVRCGAAGSTTCSAVPTFATATVDRAFTSFAVSSGLSNSSAGAMDAAGANAFLAWSAEL